MNIPDQPLLDPEQIAALGGFVQRKSRLQEGEIIKDVHGPELLVDHVSPSRDI